MRLIRRCKGPASRLAPHFATSGGRSPGSGGELFLLATRLRESMILGRRNCRTHEREGPDVEQILQGEIDFDGQFVSGNPAECSQLADDRQARRLCSLRLPEITDWM